MLTGAGEDCVAMPSFISSDPVYKPGKQSHCDLFAPWKEMATIL